MFFVCGCCCSFSISKWKFNVVVAGCTTGFSTRINTHNDVRVSAWETESEREREHFFFVEESFINRKEYKFFILQRMSFFF